MGRRAAIFTKPIIRENGVLVLLLGLCPALAVSTMAENAVGMGAVTTFVLLCSNTVVSLIKKAIPNKVRIPCYIVLIATFTVLAEMIVEAFAYSLYQSLGIFLPLVAFNCIIFARAEIFASKNRLVDSMIDAIGSGLGFTFALLAIASIREILGSGQFFGLDIPWLVDNNALIFSLAPGGFIVFALVLALVNKLTKGKALQQGQAKDCEGCASAIACGKHRLIGGVE